MTTSSEPSLGDDKRIDTSGAEPKLGGEAAILHLVEMLKHDDRKVRYRAALKLAETGDDRVFDILVEMLQDENVNPRLRGLAALALGQLGDKKAVDLLIASDDLLHPYYVIKALGQIGGDQALSVIEGYFYSRFRDDRITAAMRETLPQIRSQRVIDFLVNTIETSPEPTGPGSLAAVTLMYMGDQIVEPLLPLLNHQSNHVRLHAVVALALVKDERLVEPLITLLEDEHLPVVREAAYRLGKLGDKRAVPRLIDFLDHPDTATAKTAVKALGWLGDERAVEPLLRVLDGPKRFLREPASLSLQEIGHPKYVRMIGKKLLENEAENADVLTATLGEIGTEEARHILVTTIHQSQVTEIREAAVFALGYLGDPKVINPLVEILLNHSIPQARECAARILGIYSGVYIVNSLIEALADPDDSVRRVVSRSLGTRGNHQAVEPLIATLNDSNVNVRSAAALSLGNIGDLRAFQPLLNVLNDDHAEYARARVSAAAALGKLGDKRAVEPLIAAIPNMEGRNDRRRMAKALGRLGDQRAAKPLIDMLISYENSNLEAARALGVIGDECAVEHLKNAMYYAAWEIENSDSPTWLFHCRQLGKVCRSALEQIGTPEALAAIEDLPFRDL